MTIQGDIDQLLRFPPYGLPQEEKQPLFLSALHASHRHHFEHCLAYRKYCARRGVSAESQFENLEQFPYLPIQAFKQNWQLLRSVDASDVKVTLQSSASSGTPSRVLLDKITTKRQRQALATVLATVLGAKRQPFAILDLDPLKANAAALGARGAAIRGFLNSASRSDYFMDSDERGNLSFCLDDFKSTIQSYIDSDTPLVIFGFTYVLYIHAVAKLLDEACRFDLPTGSKIVHIGGWKKLEDQKVDRDVFNQQISQLFGIPVQEIIDFYGFTEQMGVTYPDSLHGVKHVPNFAEVIVRHPQTLQPIEDGKVGILQFLTPLPHSYPGISVLTDDLGVITGREEDDHGWHGTQFKVIGRLKKAEVRGCGDIMADKVASKNVKSSSVASETASQPKVERPDFPQPDVRLFLSHESYYGPKRLDQGVELNSLPQVKQLGELCQVLKDRRVVLQSYSVDELIALISAASRRWFEADSPVLPLSQAGLVFLRSFCSSTSLRQLADDSLKLGRGELDGFRGKGFLGRRMQRAVARGLVGHWLAGNVPLLGMLVLTQSILARNANIIKVAKNNASVLPLLLESFRGLTIKTRAGKILRGDDILETIAIIYFDRSDHQSAETLSLECDVRLAWGGRDAVESVMNLPRRFGTEDIIFGPKLSYMVIGREALHSARAVRKLARGASIDASVFDQYACASPHTIFVEQGGHCASPREFAAQLAEQMQRTSLRIPKQPVDDDTAAQITARRLQYEFSGDIWASRETSDWTVLYDEHQLQTLADPCYSRVITVSPISDAMSAAEFAHHGIQTVGLALSSERKQQFASVAAMKGAERFPDIGRMTLFDTPWDGLFPLQRLVRIVTIGGPY